MGAGLECLPPAWGYPLWEREGVGGVGGGSVGWTRSYAVCRIATKKRWAIECAHLRRAIMCARSNHRKDHRGYLFWGLNLKMAETLSEYSTKINTFYVTDITQVAIFAPNLLWFVLD